MKSLMCAAALMVMLAILPGCAGTRPAPATTPAVSQVDQLFARMEAGQYSEEIRFPNLTWADIPALLQRTNSTRMLTTFPTNPLSSERQAQCSEGMVALWLVEGIRKTPKPEFASLNPLVLPPGPQNGKDWGAISEQNWITSSSRKG